MIAAYVTDYKTGQVAGISIMGAWVWDIFENTTSEVVNDERDELWTCNLGFEIPIRNNHDVRQDITIPGPRSLTKVGA
jgi:hypothetical protein